MTTESPSPWPVERLADHASVKARLGWKGLKAEEYVDDGFIFLATPNLKASRIDFDNVNYINEWRYLESPEIQLQNGDVLLVKDGSTLGIAGHVSDLPAPTTVNGSIAVIRPRRSLDSRFLYHQVCGEEFQRRIRLGRSGLGVPHLFQADLREFPISIPELGDQRRIAEILSTVDEAIEQTEALIAKTQQIKTGLMHDLFTRGVTPDGRLRPPREQSPELYKDSPLGWIPREWDCQWLGQCVGRIDSGWSPNCAAQPADYGDWGVLKTTAVVWDGYAPFENKRLLESTVPSESIEVKQDDLLITRKGPVDRVGVVVHVPSTPPRLMFPDTVFRTRVLDPIKIGPDYIALALGCPAVQKYWWQRKVGLADAQVNLNHGILKSTPVPLSNPKEQRIIVEIIKALSERIQAIRLVCLKHLSVRRGLTHDLLTGRAGAARVPDPQGYPL